MVNFRQPLLSTAIGKRVGFESAVAGGGDCGDGGHWDMWLQLIQQPLLSIPVEHAGYIEHDVA